MQDFFTLRLLDKFSSLFTKIGVDYQNMRRILQVKLIMDQRRVPTVLMNQKKDKNGNSLNASLLTYGFIGVFIGLLILIPFPLFYKMNMVFAMIIFMVMATMISDFSAVLLDVKDKNILLPRPVDARTINTAKIIHIVIYLFTITMTISGISFLTGLVKYGFLFAFLFLGELILICLFVVFFTSILYLAILSFFDGEKLKDLINYFQILLSVFILIGYQFMGRIFNLSHLNVSFQPAWWHSLIPTTWFAAPFSLFIENRVTGYFVHLSWLAVVVPALTTILYIVLVIPYFEGKLQKLNSEISRPHRGRDIKEKLHHFTARLVCFNQTEAAFYQFTQNMLANERKLKLRLYPNLAFALAMPFIMLFSMLSNEKSAANIMTNIASGKFYLALYFTIAFLSLSITLLGSSENYAGAWIYRALPLESPVPVFKGALKGFIFKFMVPIYFFPALVFILLCGYRIIPDIILIFLNMLVLLLFTFNFNHKELPFHKDFQVMQAGDRLGTVMLSFLICGICTLVHLLLTYTAFGVTINIVISLVLVMILWNTSFQITWEDIH